MKDSKAAPATVAVISVNDDSLNFAWETIKTNDTRNRAHALANCVLRVAYPGGHGLIARRAPFTDVPAIPISFDNPENYVLLNSVKAWPRAKLKLDVPDVFKQKAAERGYSIGGSGTDKLRITSHEKDMPHFTLIMDSQHRRVQLTYDWTLLTPPDGANERLMTKSRQLKKQVNDISDKISSLVKKKERFQKEKRKEDEIVGVQNDIDTTNAEKKIVEGQLSAVITIKDTWLLEQTTIPFIVFMQVESERVTVAETALPPNSAQ